MKLYKPKQVTWRIALVFGLVGIVAHFVRIPVLSGLSFWLVSVGFVLLILSTVLKNF